jgi:hypothetical protein
MPYLETMLLDKAPNLSAGAARGVCAEFACDADLRAIADRQLIDACRFTLLAVNRISNHGPVTGAATGVDSKILGAWLNAHVKEVRRLIHLDPRPAPAWFAAPFGN